MHFASKIFRRKVFKGVSFKIALGPVIATLILTALMGVAISGIERNRTALIVLHDEAGAAVKRGEQATVTMLTLQSTLFQYVSWLTMHGDPQDILQMKGNITGSLDLLDTISATDPTLLKSDIVKSLRAKVRTAVSLSELNISLGFSNVLLLQKIISNVHDDLVHELNGRTISADTAYAVAIREAQQLKTLLISATVFLLIVLLLAAWLASRTVVRGVSRLTQSMTALATGAQAALAASIPEVERGDEIGSMARAVVVFRDNAVRAQTMEREQLEASKRRTAEDERLRAAANEAAAAEAAALVVGSIGAGLERLAAGDLTYRLETALPSAYEKLRSDLNMAVQQLHDLVRGIVVNTAGIRSGTTEFTQAADDLGRRTEQQAASLEETAAALDEITATVSKTANGAQEARQVVSKTKRDAELSGVVVQQAIVAMGEIDRSSKQIGDIIGVIDEIAFQTNLLALNAGVEASHAGDAGRGFAVVAVEVRALAQRSAEAAKEIKSLITASAQHVGIGVKLVGETGQALTRIVGQVASLTDVMSKIAASAQDQATGLAEVNTAVNRMDQVTQQNAAMVEQSTAASHALAREAEALAQLTGRFQTSGQTSCDAVAIAPLRRAVRQTASRL